MKKYLIITAILFSAFGYSQVIGADMLNMGVKTTAEMNAITVGQGLQKGSFVYNSSTESIHTYDGTNWNDMGGVGSVGADNQQLSFSGTTLTLEDGGTPIDLDNAFATNAQLTIGLNGKDGSETKINAGSNVTISGEGTIGNPYVIGATTGGGSTYTAGTGLTESPTGTFNVNETYLNGVYLPLDGSQSMEGNLDMDEYSITNGDNGQFRNVQILSNDPDWHISIGKFSADASLEFSSGDAPLGLAYTLRPNGNPLIDTDLVDKAYVDNLIGGSGGTDDQTAAEVTIADIAENFTATDVEGALAELAGSGVGSGFGIVAEGTFKPLGSNINTITHGLGYSPEITRIQIQIIDYTNSVITSPSIENITNTTFDLVCSSNTSFEYAWRIFGSGSIVGQTAAEVTYDNSTSGLTATDVQGAIDELETTINGSSIPIALTTSLNGTELSTETSKYNFTGSAVTISEPTPDEFTISINSATYDERAAFSSRAFPLDGQTIAQAYPSLTQSEVRTLTGNDTATLSDTAEWFYLQEVLHANATNFYNVESTKTIKIPSGVVYDVSKPIVLDIGGSTVDFTGTKIQATGGMTDFVVKIVSQWGFGTYDKLYVSGNYTAGGIFIDHLYNDINNTLATVNHWHLKDVHVEQSTVGIKMSDTYYGKISGHSAIHSSLTGLYTNDEYPNGWYGTSGPGAEVNTIDFRGMDFQGPNSSDLSAFGVASNYETRGAHIGSSLLNVGLDQTTFENWHTAIYLSDDTDQAATNKQPFVSISNIYFENNSHYVLNVNYNRAGSYMKLAFNDNHIFNNTQQSGVPTINIAAYGSYEMMGNNVTESEQPIVRFAESAGFKQTKVRTNFEPFQIVNNVSSPNGLIIKYEQSMDADKRNKWDVKNYVNVGESQSNNAPLKKVIANKVIDEDKLAVTYPETVSGLPTQYVNFQTATNNSLRDIAFTADNTGTIYKDVSTGKFWRFIIDNGEPKLREENLLGKIYDVADSKNINFFLNSGESGRWYSKGHQYSVLTGSGNSWTQNVSGTVTQAIGTTAQRPTTRPVGYNYYDVDLSNWYTWNGSAWGLTNAPINDISLQGGGGGLTTNQTRELSNAKRDPINVVYTGSNTNTMTPSGQYVTSGEDYGRPIIYTILDQEQTKMVDTSYEVGTVLRFEIWGTGTLNIIPTGSQVFEYDGKTTLPGITMTGLNNKGYLKKKAENLWVFEGKQFEGYADNSSNTNRLLNGTLAYNEVTVTDTPPNYTVTGNGQSQFGRLEITIPIASNNLAVGDTVVLSVGSMSGTGVSRVQVNTGNADSSIATLTAAGTVTGTIVSGTTDLVVWLFSDYGNVTSNQSVYTNVSLTKQ